MFKLIKELIIYFDGIFMFNLKLKGIAKTSTSFIQIGRV